MNFRDVPMPQSISRLPVNDAGYPIPWFVQWIDGVPDFRIMDERKLVRAVRDRRCWTCGKLLIGDTSVFVIGPMCAVNRISSEPPSHPGCARYAAQACPFLSNPSKRRREGKLPDHADPAGVMVERNPGVTLAWWSNDWSPVKVPAVTRGSMSGGAGLLFKIGEPRKVEWYCEGRAATRVEVVDAIDSGMPLLTEAARADGGDAIAELADRLKLALMLVP